MKILVLGGSGYIGTRLCAALAASGWATPVSASARHATPGVEHRRVDTRQLGSLTQALRGIDAVVNCVAGDAAAIARGAQVLTEACVDADCPRIVHLSSMSVYGTQEGQVQEQAPLDPALGWYARAKCESEQRMAAFAHAYQPSAGSSGACSWTWPSCVPYTDMLLRCTMRG
ncbi:MAG: NAD(P)-dependent oxidoreductase, partial [Comamonadaceae bacterium]